MTWMFLTSCVCRLPRSFGLTRSWAHKVGLHKQDQQQRQREASAGIDPHNNRLTRSAMTPQQSTLVRSPSTLRCGYPHACTLNPKSDQTIRPDPDLRLVVVWSDEPTQYNDPCRTLRWVLL